MANHASALGEAIGHLIEREVQSVVREAVIGLDCIVDTGGERKEKRKGKRLLLVNDTGNEYQIDTVVEDSLGNPIVLLECKYIRYKKHNRDKASWTCVAHYKLRTTYHTVKKSIAVLIGDWTAPSKRLMNSFGVEIIEIPFGHLSDILGRHGVIFRWAENDSETPINSLIAFNALGVDAKNQIAKECVDLIAQELKDLVYNAVKSSEIKIRSVSQIELLLKTNENEYVVKKFTDLPNAITYLVSLTAQKEDVGDMIKRI